MKKTEEMLQDDADQSWLRQSEVREQYFMLIAGAAMLGFIFGVAVTLLSLPLP